MDEKRQTNQNARKMDLARFGEVGTGEYLAANRGQTST
jgi:hypothetical protein